MKTASTMPAWVTETLAEADRRFDREVEDLRRRIDSEALTEAMREHTPIGLPDLEWRVSRWDDGAHNFWACPVNKSFICLFPDEIRENAAIFAAWLEALQGPAPTEAPPIKGLSNPALVFESPCHLAGLDFTLCFRPWTGQVGADEVRRIVAEAIASDAAGRAVVA